MLILSNNITILFTSSNSFHLFMWIHFLISIQFCSHSPPYFQINYISICYRFNDTVIYILFCSYFLNNLREERRKDPFWIKVCFSNLIVIRNIFNLISHIPWILFVLIKCSDPYAVLLGYTMNFRKIESVQWVSKYMSTKC